MSLTYQPFAELPELNELRQDMERNVRPPERMLSIFAGAALGLLGASRRSLGGTLLMLVGGALAYRGATGHCQVYEALGINSRERGIHGVRGIKVEKSIDIQAPRADVYHFWRSLENLPRFMSHLKSVKNLGKGRSHWVVRGPIGVSVEWDAQIINEHENEMLAWESLPGASVQNAGTVRFEELPEGGTRLRINLEFHPPAGAAGAAVARFFGEDPDQQMEEDLHRFRQHMEEQVGTAGQIAPPRSKMIS